MRVSGKPLIPDEFQEAAYLMQFSGQGTSAQPLDQRQLDLWLLAQRGGEADLRGVVTSYYSCKRADQQLERQQCGSSRDRTKPNAIGNTYKVKQRFRLN